MYEKLITKTLVLYEIYFLYESGIFKNYFHTLYEISTTRSRQVLVQTRLHLFALHIADN
jgi:hypothetical protein